MNTVTVDKLNIFDPRRGMREGVWKSGEKTIKGYWAYCGNDRFHILLNSKDKITGLQHSFDVVGESPEWGNWLRVQS